MGDRMTGQSPYDSSAAKTAKYVEECRRTYDPKNFNMGNLHTCVKCNTGFMNFEVFHKHHQRNHANTGETHFCSTCGEHFWSRAEAMGHCKYNKN